MRIAIFTNDDLTSNVIFAPLFSIPDVEVACVRFAAGPRKGAKSTVGGALGLLRRVALRYWLYLVVTNSLFKLFDVVTVVLGLDPHNGSLTSLRRLAIKHGVPCDRVPDFNAAGVMADLKSRNVDLLVIRIGAVLKAELLSIPRMGTWCVHSSLLPSFKGIAGEFHALRTPAAPIGSTVFLVSPKLDEGAPLAQVAIARQEDGSVFQHMLANNLAAAELLSCMVRQVITGGAPRKMLFNEGLEPSYWSWPQPKDVRQLRSGGKKLMSVRECIQLAATCLRLG